MGVLFILDLLRLRFWLMPAPHEADWSNAVVSMAGSQPSRYSLGFSQAAQFSRS